MAWVAVDKDGTEKISNGTLLRYYSQSWYDKDIYGFDHSIQLPSGSIHKLIGRTLTWDYEPVELK